MFYALMILHWPPKYNFFKEEGKTILKSLNDETDSYIVHFTWKCISEICLEDEKFRCEMGAATVANLIRHEFGFSFSV